MAKIYTGLWCVCNGKPHIYSHIYACRNSNNILANKYANSSMPVYYITCVCNIILYYNSNAIKKMPHLPNNIAFIRRPTIIFLKKTHI